MIDLATRKSQRIQLGEGAELFDLSPDGKTLYLTNEEDAELVVFDLASGQRKSAIKVGEEPEGVKVSADGKTLYVTSEVASLVHVIDLPAARWPRTSPWASARAALH